MNVEKFVIIERLARSFLEAARITYVKLAIGSLGLGCRTSTSTSEKYISTRDALLLDWVLRGL